MKRPGNGEKQTEMMGAREGGFDAPTRWCSYANDNILVPLFGDIIYQTPHQGIFFCAVLHTYTHAYMHIHTFGDTHSFWWIQEPWMPTMMEGHVLFVALHTLSVSPRHIRALHCEPSSFLIKSFSRVHFLSQSLHRNLFRLYGSLVAVVQKTKSSQTYIPKKIIVLIIYHHAVFIVHRAVVNLLLCSNQCLH